MPTYWGSIAQGIGQGITQAQQQQARELEIQNYRRQMEQQRLDEARKLQAEQGVGATLGALYAPPPVTQAPQPPMPGQPSVPGAQAQPQGQGPAGVPPYRTVQSAGAAAQQPTQPMPQGAPPAVQPQGQMQRPTVENVMRIMAANGVPQDQWLGQLERLKPVFDAANREEVEQLKVQNAQLQQRKLDIYERNVESQIRKRGGAGGGEAGAGGVGVGGAAKGGIAYDRMTPDQKRTIDYFANQSMNYDDKWKTGLSRTTGGSAMIRAVNERIAQLASGTGGGPGDVAANRATYQADQKALTTLTQMAGGVNRSAKQLDGQLGIIEKQLDSGAGLDTPTAINGLINKVRKGASSIDYSNMNQAMVTASSELQRLTTAPASNAQLHVTAAQKFAENLSPNMSRDQIKAQIKLIRQEMKLAEDASNSAIKDVQDNIRKIGKSPSSGGAGGTGKPLGVGESTTIGGVKIERVN